MVLCLEATSIDRGACIKKFSQYPDEVEYLYVPCSFVEPTGQRRLEETTTKGNESTGLLWMIHVRVNANLKSFTVEELKERKKQMHLAAFDYLLAETERALVAIAGEEKSKAKWEGENDYWKRKYKLSDFITKIVDEGKALKKRHESVDPDHYNQDLKYRGLVEEMLHYRTAAESALRCYVEDGGLGINECLQLYYKNDVWILHRRYTDLLWKKIATPSAAQPTPSVAQQAEAPSAVDHPEAPGTADQPDVPNAAQHTDAPSDTDEPDAPSAQPDAPNAAQQTEAPSAQPDAPSAAQQALRFCQLMGLVKESADELDSEGMTPLMQEIRKSQESRSLIGLASAGGIDMGRTSDGWTALILATEGGQTEVVKVLLEKGADINKGTRSDDHNKRRLGQCEASNSSGCTALISAAEMGHTEIVKILLERGADANKASSNGWTALMYAADRGHTESMKVLLEKGADMDKAESFDERTALMYAAQGGHTEMVKILLERGANANKATRYGWTVLMWAALGGHTESMKLLLEKGADVHLATTSSHLENDGWTALMWTASGDHIDAMKLLLEKGADTNKADNNGVTALMIAAEKGHTEAIKTLLQHGALMVRMILVFSTVL